MNLFSLRFFVPQVFASPTVSLCHSVVFLCVLYLCVLVLFRVVCCCFNANDIFVFLLVARFSSLSASVFQLPSSEGPCEERRHRDDVEDGTGQDVDDDVLTAVCDVFRSSPSRFPTVASGYRSGCFIEFICSRCRRRVAHRHSRRLGSV